MSAEGHAQRDDLLVAISRAHYLEHQSKVQVAAQHGISRFQVASLLREARERGIVRITIGLPDQLADHQAATALGIRAVKSAETDDVPQLLADTIHAHATPGARIGIAWSRAIQAAMPLLPPLTECDVVQLAGAISVGSPEGGVRLLANLSARTAWPLWAPLVVPDATGIRSSPEVSQTLAMAHDLDLAVVAVGRWAPGGSTVWDRVPEQVRRATVGAGAVGEVSGHLFTQNGELVDGGIGSMTVSASVEDLVAARNKLAVARGADRAVGVVAAVRAGLVDTLVCDRALRDRLVADADHEPS